MPRRREVPKRPPQPDPIYNSQLVSSFVNVIMKRGKKATAEGVVYRAFDKIRERTQEDPLKVFKKAIDNIKPTLEVKSRRVGGSNYQVPVEVRPERRTSLSDQLAERRQLRPVSLRAPKCLESLKKRRTRTGFRTTRRV